MRPKARVFFLVAGISGCLLSSCSSYPSKIGSSRRAFESGNYEVAIQELQELSSKKDSDELLFLLELGVAYHAAEQWDKAIEVFQQAEKLGSLTDYTSVSQEAGSILLNDTLKNHKLDEYEKVLINTYLAMDFTLQKKWESALVECRRINHKTDQIIASGQPGFSRNAFSKYLAGLIFENEREFNDAWVDYKASYQWLPDFPFHATALLRMADKLKAQQEMLQYKKLFPETSDYRLQKGWGELVVLAELGRAPYKIEDPAFRLVPLMVRSAYAVDHLVVRGLHSAVKSRTYTLFDIENTAILELEERRSALVAKKLGGIVAKQAAGYGIEKVTKSPELGALSALLLHLTDRPDLRSWAFLPAKLQLARLALPAGVHEIVLEGAFSSGQSNGWTQVKKVEILPGAITFVNARVVN